MEPVSLALGVLPLVGGALKTCKVIRKKLKIFRHYSREIGRVQKRVQLQSDLFANEIRLLLRPSIQDGTIVDSMLKDKHHPQWTCQELEKGMRDTLGDSYDTCQSVIGEIGSAMTSLRSVFDCFEELLDQCPQGEHPKDSIRRLRARVKIAHDESKLNQNIEELRQNIDDLKRLREQTQELCKLSVAKRAQKSSEKKMKTFSTIREASNALHEALGISWSRMLGSAVADEIRHTVRLFLKSQVQEDVYMNAVITCRHGPGSENSLKDKMTILRVRSRHRGLGDLLNPPSYDESGSSSEGPRKRRKITFVNTDSRKSLTLDQPLSSLSSLFSNESNLWEADLSSTRLCPAIYSSCNLPLTPKNVDSCIGYIDGGLEGNFRHYLCGNANIEWTNPNPSLMRMSDVFSKSSEVSISITDQLKIALEVVSAVLKLYSTPWLRKHFHLDDLAFYDTGRELSSCLQTLCISTDFTQRTSAQTLRFNQEVRKCIADLPPPIDLDDAMEDAKLQYGVRNLTLWSLGTILLQIGRWSKLETPDDVIGIRKLSAHIPMLGRRYRDLTKKCLDCDFGFGDDLSRPRLQQAVYESVFCELSEMISILDFETSWLDK